VPVTNRPPSKRGGAEHPSRSIKAAAIVAASSLASTSCNALYYRKLIRSLVWNGHGEAAELRAAAVPRRGPDMLQSVTPIQQKRLHMPLQATPKTRQYPA